MGACARKHKPNDNESNSDQQGRTFPFSTALKRDPVASTIYNESKSTKEFITTENAAADVEPSATDGQNKASSTTTLYDLPLEMLDIILQKSYLHWILNSPAKQRDEEVIKSLISVDVCFNRRITRKRSRKEIWRYLKDFYGQIKKRSAVIRNNRNYLLDNIEPSEELIVSLVSLNCITEEQSHLVQRQRSHLDQNDELLYIVEPLDETKLSNVVKCFRQNNQKTVARIIENGGGVIKVEVQTRGAKCTASLETQRLHQKLEDLRNRTKPWSHQTEKLICQLNDEGIEILNSQLNRQTVVVWIWCRSQAALECIQKMYESNHLRDVFETIQPSTSKVINIDGNQLKQTFVVCPISVNLTRSIEIREGDFVYGVTKLRNEICVLSQPSFADPIVIRIFEERSPFRLQKKIKVKEIKSPWDIGSSEKESCLYVSDREEKCVWKITRELDNQHKIIKFLTTDYYPYTLSVSSAGQLLVVDGFSTILMIYGSNAELIRSIQLQRDIGIPIHAVETSIGNFIIIQNYVGENEGESGSSGIKKGWMRGICELTRDGQMVTRRFIPSNETQNLKNPSYLSLDSDDGVFVADYENDRVILLDCDLKWNRILCTTKEVKNQRIYRPQRLCYDADMMQVIIGGDFSLQFASKMK